MSPENLLTAASRQPALGVDLRFGIVKSVDDFGTQGEFRRRSCSIGWQ